LESSWPPTTTEQTQQQQNKHSPLEQTCCNYLATSIINKQTFAQIILISVHNNSTTNDTVLTIERDQSVLYLELASSIVTDGDVAEITSMTIVIARTSVVLGGRVEVRASRRASVGGITIGVDMESVLA
jgi:hypothetical protein